MIRNHLPDEAKNIQTTDKAKNNFNNMHKNVYQRLQTTLFEMKQRI